MSVVEHHQPSWSSLRCLTGVFQPLLLSPKLAEDFAQDQDSMEGLAAGVIRDLVGIREHLCYQQVEVVMKEERRIASG